MIRYALICDHKHEFESWFPSGEAYDEQCERGLVSCPFCDSKKIEKQIMAPSVARTDNEITIRPAESTPEPTADTKSMTLLSEKELQVRTMLRALHKHVIENAEDVGTKFPEEARKMHHGETENRSIFGQASLDEAKALVEEGIEVMPLPTLPDDRN